MVKDLGKDLVRVTDPAEIVGHIPTSHRAQAGWMRKIDLGPQALHRVSRALALRGYGFF